jgi:hypothetical protein
MKLRSAEHDLFSFSHHPRWRAEFPQKVARQQGILPVFIHPFFVQYRDYPEWGIKKKILKLTSSARENRGESSVSRLTNHEKQRSELSTRGYLLRLGQFLARTDFELLVLGEHTPEISTSVSLFRKMGYRGLILTYGTESGDPHPRDGEWHEVGEAINLLAASLVVVGGQLLRVYRHNDGQVEVSGCVSGFSRSGPEPIGGPRVLLSPIAYPNWQLIKPGKPAFPAERIYRRE